MLDLGFEPHIRAIAQQTRADRQTLMFSATWPPSIQKLASEFLSDPVKVTIGSADLSASHSVSQVLTVQSLDLNSLFSQSSCQISHLPSVRVFCARRTVTEG